MEEIEPEATMESYVPPPMFGSGISKKIPSPVWIERAKQKNFEQPPLPGRKPALTERDPAGYSEYTQIIDGTPTLNNGSYYPSPQKQVSLERSGVPKRPHKSQSPVFRNPVENQNINLEMSMLEQPTAQDILAKIDVKAVEAEALFDSKTDRFSISYQKGEIALSDETRKLLEAEILPKALKGRPILLESYASTSAEGDPTSRRLSLARALEIRDYLVGRKMPSENIEIRPLGTKTSGNTEKIASDRVDILILEKAPH